MKTKVKKEYKKPKVLAGSKSFMDISPNGDLVFKELIPPGMRSKPCTLNRPGGG